MKSDSSDHRHNTKKQNTHIYNSKIHKLQWWRKLCFLMGSSKFINEEI